MNSNLSQSWIAANKIELFIQLEPAILILVLSFGAWLTSRLFLRDLSPQRQRNLGNLFKNLGYYLLLGVTLFIIYHILRQLGAQSPTPQRLMVYSGLGTILMGAIVFVKVWRILVFEYFFLSHMKVAFPVLLVNLFTLLLSLVLATWIGTEIFNIRLTPILATSAIFSLVLGLAMQDTLGNLFAGIALQFDKPFEIGDWIEIQTQGQKWVGQVYEISWRATVLIAVTEESITVANRIVAQAQVSNFSTRYRPIIRTQLFRLPFGVNIDKVKNLLLKVAESVPEIKKVPHAKVYLSETTESWVGFKLIYFIDNYGRQFAIADQIYTLALRSLETQGIDLAAHRLKLEDSGATSRPTHPSLGRSTELGKAQSE